MSNGDLNNDNTTNIRDLNLLLQNWTENSNQELQNIIQNWNLHFSNNNFFKYHISNATNFDLSSYLQTFQDAFDKWDSVVTSNNIQIEVTVSFDEMDEDILGGAYIEEYYTGYSEFGSVFPKKGVFILNTMYLNMLHTMVYSNGKSNLYYTVLHELGHILGIGPTWVNDNITNKPIGTYQINGETKKYYNGAHALEQYKSYFPDISNNLVGIPIEDDGGGGTESVHPEEGYIHGHSTNDREINGVYHPGLRHELMTGWMESSSYPIPMSRITIGFLKDIGYNVDYSEAEFYDPTNPFSTS